MKFITYLFLLLPFVTISQNITYSGVVKDNVTHQPIEHVSISVYNSNISTLTNSEGRFRIMVPKEFNKLNFSHINYDGHDVVVSSSQEEIQVYLSDTSYELEEMIIYDRPIKDIMKEVIDNSKAKFAKDIKLNTYYREVVNVDNSVYSYADGMLDYYFKNKSNSNIIVNESRAIQFNSPDFKTYEDAPIKFYLLDLQTIITDAFKFERVWKIIKNKNYDLFITSKRSPSGKELKTLYFEPSDLNNEDYLQGTLIFDEDEKLVLEINIDLSPKHLKNIKNSNRIIYDVKFSEMKFKQIFNTNNNRYFLAYDTRRIAGKVNSGKKHSFLIGGVHELITVNSDISKVNPDPKEIYHQKTLATLGKNFETKYWEKQNMILLTKKEEEMLKKINN